ncbi:RagB/SusD family nutrient uptake outer membrane protein [Parapedobacter lycopersici]|uniref:RagB/SusD family nutrient uptake outer membrane protein n=1 Tax=Parapedobacter lycopersici TaxID=1864939 RepID=UPI00214DF063|nr:RagB/SusD family nutrient uptake outer membrane protein [Parapedobacter lycopersici]
MKKIYFIIHLLIGSTVLSCSELVEIDPPTDSLSGDHLFADDASATSVLNGMYTQLVKAGFASGSSASVTLLAGASADGFVANGSSIASQDIAAFNENALHSEIQGVAGLWNSLYQQVFYANTALEGLAAADGLSSPVKRQLQGEALFVRAFCYFYLVNLFGEVPLALTGDYRVNNALTRASVAAVYAQLMADLREAVELLPEGFAHTGGERVRPNRAAAQALLARALLFTGDWPGAVEQASAVIDRTDMYRLTPLDAVFLKNSEAAIWQLIPPNAYTNEGWSYIPAENSLPRYVTLSDGLLALFQPDDQRLAEWIGRSTYLDLEFYYPHKYKVWDNSMPQDEYTMVLRLAEQYLIRAEALARQDQLAEAKADMDALRGRAGLDGLPDGMGKEALLAEIENERFRELFGEWGHRWLDLKRTGRVDAVLSVVKPNWQSYQQLYPIPKVELDRNGNLNPNPNYEN